MFIKCVGPPPSSFDPSCYTKTWIMKHDCLADDTRAQKRKIQDDDHEYEVIWKKLQTE